jgi:hypothetical protein
MGTRQAKQGSLFSWLALSSNAYRSWSLVLEGRRGPGPRDLSRKFSAPLPRGLGVAQTLKKESTEKTLTHLFFYKNSASFYYLLFNNKTAARL